MELNDVDIKNTQVNIKEFKILQRVLREYHIEPNEIYSCGNAYKVICTNNKSICLKKRKHGEYKVKNSYYLIEELKKSGFVKTSSFYKTKKGNLYLKHKKNIYYVTEWIDGEECSMDNIVEVINCCKLIAEFHGKCSSISFDKVELKNNIKNWSNIYKKNLRDLLVYKKIIENKYKLDTFDTLYLNSIDEFYQIGSRAYEILSNSKYFPVEVNCDRYRTICQDCFSFENVIKSNNSYYFMDFDRININLRIYDLGRIIKRFMYYHEYKWDFTKTKQLIDAYNSINRLDKIELEMMLSLIIFPEKFCKIGRKRYIKKKDWIEEKYIHKLNRLLKNTNYKEKFIKEYINYLENYD